MANETADAVCVIAGPTGVSRRGHDILWDYQQKLTMFSRWKRYLAQHQYVKGLCPILFWCVWLWLTSRSPLP